MDALDTRVVVVPDADTKRGAGIAAAMAGLELSGLPTAIVLAGTDTDALATLASELGAAGVRIAVLVDDVATEGGRAALVELVSELFPRRNS